MLANGPAVGLVSVTRRSIRAESWYPAPAGPENCHGARRVWRTFCRPGTNFVEYYACRGTGLIGATNLSSGKKLVAGTGAVSRYKARSKPENCQGVDDFNCEQMRVSGCNNHYETVLGAGAKAKSVTSLLTLPSVLAVRVLFC